MKIALLVFCLLSSTAYGQNVQKQIMADLKVAGYEILEQDSAQLVIKKQANMYEEYGHVAMLLFEKNGRSEHIHVITQIQSFDTTDPRLPYASTLALLVNQNAACGHFFTLPDVGEIGSIDFYLGHFIPTSCYNSRMLIELLECMRAHQQRWRSIGSSGFSSSEKTKLPHAVIKKYRVGITK